MLLVERQVSRLTLSELPQRPNAASPTGGEPTPLSAAAVRCRLTNPLGTNAAGENAQPAAARHRGPTRHAQRDTTRRMPNRLLFAIVQVVGGLSVLGSYAHGAVTHPDTVERLWGTIPEVLWTPYSLCMPPAAVGYLVATWMLWRRSPNAEGYRRTMAWYAGFLVTSAVWMPLCFAALDHQRASLLPVIQIDLALAGGFALAVAWEIHKSDLSRRRLALAAWAFLCWQCVVLDALVWPRFFVV